MIFPVIDAFSLNGYLKDLPFRYFPAALSELAELRNSPGQFRWYSAPQDIEKPIDATDTHYAQLVIPIGTVIWGMSFVAIDGAVDEFYLQIAEADDERWFESFVCATMFASNNTARLRPVLMPRPHVIKTGTLKVSINNTDTANAQRCQLLFWTTKPGLEDGQQ
jgi:hypothetical protein